MKYSRQRELILNTVLSHPIHPTADELYNKLKENFPNLSLGTVYRNLNLLAEHGEIMKLKMEEGPDRYDGCTKEHFHMECRVCGKVIDLEISGLDQTFNKAVADVKEHKVEDIKVAFKGVCKDCFENING